MQIIKSCIEAGAFWTLENPATSLVFEMPNLCRIRRLGSTLEVVTDKCIFGFADSVSSLLYQKRIRFIGNFVGLERLGRRCDHSHEHEPVLGKVQWDGKSRNRSEPAGAYPASLASELASLVKRSLEASTRARRVCCSSRHAA